jgi:hypothetical protein
MSFRAVSFIFSFVLVFGIAGRSPAQTIPDFGQDIWPIIDSKCVKCHGPRKLRGEVRLDLPTEFLLKDGQTVLSPGDPEDSLLVEVISFPEGHADIMPPKGELVTDPEIALIRRWVADGAEFGIWGEEHTSKRPVITRNDLPTDVKKELFKFDGMVQFNRDIRPILSNNCFKCHGPDANQRKAKLRLDDRENALIDRDGVSAIVSGKARDSEIVFRILSDDGEMLMPPHDSEKSLSAREKALLYLWIDQGAEYESHWAYTTLRRPGLPSIRQKDWVKNSIDHFILSVLERSGLEPSPLAAPHTLIRRAYFDLTGLPPAYAVVEGAGGRLSDKAYGKMIKELLASPHYGEKMAQPWLDVVRYADTTGFHSDDYRSVWPYRDYVIQAFNDNLPFDQFTLEQMAGDLFPDATQQQLIASGYNRLNQVTSEGGAQPGEYLIKYRHDRVRTTATAWLGTTMGCAECHDHKFDPITTKEFYQFASFFADLKERGKYEKGRYGYEPFIRIPTKKEQTELSSIEKEISKLSKKGGKGDQTRVAKEIDRLKRKKKHIEENIATTLVAKAIEPREVRILPRGDWLNNTGEVVEPGIPSKLHESEFEGERATRMDLGQWLVDEKNPLTARVFVNRLWKQFFGTGLSKVLDDMGLQGEYPSHPELLDWLAVEFMESGWDVKHMVELIVTSNTYRQSSMPRPDAATKDPYNRLLARQNRIRLEAEQVRDNALSVSGLLVAQVGGPSVKPYQPEAYFADTYASVGNQKVYTVDTGEKQYRRGMYTYWKRSFLHPSMLAFDAPNREECVAQRVVSNIPQQALVLLNDPTYVETARAFAVRMIQDGGESIQERLEFGWKEALSREPTSAEASILGGLVERHRQDYGDQVETAVELNSVGQSNFPSDILPEELAAWTSVARAILNTHESITRY